MMSDFQLMSWSAYWGQVIHFHGGKKDQWTWSWGLQKLNGRNSRNTDSFLSGEKLLKVMK